MVGYAMTGYSMVSVLTVGVLLFISGVWSIGMLSVMSQLNGSPYNVCTDASVDDNRGMAYDHRLGADEDERRALLFGRSRLRERRRISSRLSDYVCVDCFLRALLFDDDWCEDQ